jgi:hypothetical protein
MRSVMRVLIIRHGESVLRRIGYWERARALVDPSPRNYDGARGNEHEVRVFHRGGNPEVGSRRSEVGGRRFASPLPVRPRHGEFVRQANNGGHGEWSELGSRDMDQTTRGARVRERDANESIRPLADRTLEVSGPRKADDGASQILNR